MNKYMTDDHSKQVAEEAKQVMQEIQSLKERANKLVARLHNSGDKEKAEKLKEALKKK